MLGKVAKVVFGSRNDRVVKKYRKKAQLINDLESDYESLSDAELQAKTDEFKARIADGVSLDSLLVEAFAVVREASKRVMGMRHYDVQLIGAMVLHEGRIAEMRTGEGKTLMGTLAIYLNALSGKGAHVITVNDYLAERDGAWMGKLYGFLGLSAGTILSGMEHNGRQAAYASDITYGTNNEFGFDYLRDNMVFSSKNRVQRELNFAIIDEVDSILIDEARTPLIISGPADDSSELYMALDKVPPQLSRQADEESEGDFWADEKSKQVFISESGHDHVEQILSKQGLMPEGDSLYDSRYIALLHHLNAALRAHALFQRDVNYMVRNNEVIIVDEFTGRSMPGRRWSDGLHQAVEAKENVEIKRESQTLASITFQNYFRMYDKLSGMTGTADTEAFEFQQIYNLEVVVIPTHKPMIRDDANDLIYLDREFKYKAITADIIENLESKRPVLVGTASIEASELLSAALTANNIKHEVLNAKQHEREAHVIEQAGKAGSVTIATNMAGRGTDIVLGGSLEAMLNQLGDDASEHEIEQVKSEWSKSHQAVLDAGGLHIIGTERHESRRIDNQLRGRAGRQGDPGSSRFYISLEDDLMRIFASDRTRSLMQKLGLEGDEAIEHSMVSRMIENAQRKVEAHNFDIRKNLLEYDDVANDQRKIIYEQRNDLLSSDSIHDMLKDVRDEVVTDKINEFVPPGSIEEQWDVPGLTESLRNEFAMDLPIQDWLDKDDAMNEVALGEKIQGLATDVMNAKREQFGDDVLFKLEKDVMLQVVDHHWKEHLAAMDYLRQSVGLRGYAQKNPKQEYKRESFEMFQDLLDRLKHDVIAFMMRAQLREAEEQASPEEIDDSEVEYNHPEANSALSSEPAEASAPEPVEKPETFRREDAKVGRNDPCPCGSGKKYKQCHGKLK